MDSVERQTAGGQEALEPATVDEQPPNWATVSEEIACPRCGYNLRGLTRGRCPECGLEFSWAAVLQAARDRREWLFEHQWRRRPVRSFLKTTTRTLRPIRFWRSIALTDQPNRKALWFMAILLSVWIPLSPLIGSLIAWGLSTGIYGLQDIAGANLSSGTVVELYVAVIDRIDWKGIGSSIRYAPEQLPRVLWTNLRGMIPFLIPFVYFGSILAALHIFQETLGRFRIRRAHLLRAAVYSLAPVYVWPVFFFAYALAFDAAYGVTWGVPFPRLSTIGVIATGLLVPVIWLVPPISLMIGLHVYLQLPRGWMLGLASVIIAVLVTVNVQLAAMVF